jgi:hypothetical protein
MSVQHQHRELWERGGGSRRGGARRGTEVCKTMPPEMSRWHLPGDLVMLVYRDEARGRP